MAGLSEIIEVNFEIDKKKYAIEVETGSMLSRRKALIERVGLLNKNYDKWFFVVTDPNKIIKYSQLGDTANARYVKKRLEKIIKSTIKSKK